mmetsp:Transcript_21286/g.28521  ORF Transcript_21286/g.28521 Transcript_21286/m.28521 type:complete len:94 (+) Transcript_21286:115-396(+)
MHVDKRKKTQKQRQQHQVMMYMNYETKLQEIEHQNALIAARREEERERMGIQASYLQKIKEKAAKATRDSRQKNFARIQESQLIEEITNKQKA